MLKSTFRYVTVKWSTGKLVLVRNLLENRFLDKKQIDLGRGEAITMAQIVAE